MGQRSALIRFPEQSKIRKRLRFLWKLGQTQSASSPCRKSSPTMETSKHFGMRTTSSRLKTATVTRPPSGLTGWNSKAHLAVPANNGSNDAKLNCMQTRRSVVGTTDTSKVGMKRAKHSWIPVSLRKVSLMSRKQNFEFVSLRRKVRPTVATLMIHSLRWVHF